MIRKNSEPPSRRIRCSSTISRTARIDEMFALLFKSTKENLSKIIQELTKLRPHPGKLDGEEEVDAEEREVKADGEEMKKKESSDKSLLCLPPWIFVRRRRPRLKLRRPNRTTATTSGKLKRC